MTTLRPIMEIKATVSAEEYEHHLKMEEYFAHVMKERAKSEELSKSLGKFETESVWGTGSPGAYTPKTGWHPTRPSPEGLGDIVAGEVRWEPVGPSTSKKVSFLEATRDKDGTEKLLGDDGRVYVRHWGDADPFVRSERPISEYIRKPPRPYEMGIDGRIWHSATWPGEPESLDIDKFFIDEKTLLLYKERESEVNWAIQTIEISKLLWEQTSMYRFELSSEFVPSVTITIKERQWIAVPHGIVNFVAFDRINTSSLPDYLATVEVTEDEMVHGFGSGFVPLVFQHLYKIICD